MTTPPTHPDIRRQIRARLLALTPRAFELFAGDLLVYIGLQNVAVTRFSGDGGIDAHGDLVAESGLVRVRTGVQVKRYRQNVGRPDIDRFIGAYGGQYDRGIFITTTGYAEQARVKAATSPLLRVDTIDGTQIAGLMLRHNLGITLAGTTAQLDEGYFRTFEAQLAAPARTGEDRAAYVADGIAAAPADDLISLRALSYTLRLDTTTLRRWIERKRLIPDRRGTAGGQEGFFFRRDRVEQIRQELAGAPLPATGTEWRQEFLDYARSRNLTKSYKPVLLRALLQLVDRNGAAHIADLAREFQQFYIQRQIAGLPTESDGPLKDAAAATLDAVRKLIVRFPLDRFLIKHFLEYDPQTGIVRFAPPLWQELRLYDLLDIQASVEQQLRYYYERTQD